MSKKKYFHRLQILKKQDLDKILMYLNYIQLNFNHGESKKNVNLPGHDRSLQKCKIFCPDLQTCLISIGLHRGQDQVCSFFQFHVSDFALAVLHKIFRQPNLIFLDHEFFHVAMHLY